MTAEGRRATVQRWLCRALVAAYLVALALWAWDAGTQVRERAWTSSRTIRFHNDIENAMRWGNRVLRVAEAMADGRSVPDTVTADAAAPSRDAAHPLTFFQVVRGEGRTYADLIDAAPGGDFDLDYPPLRLLTMSLWTQAVQQRFPHLTHWPGRASARNANGSRAAASATEDVAEPLLRMNARAGAATAVVAFALVWLWVDRGSRPGPAPAGRRRPRRGPPTPLSRANGLILFPLCAAAFTYAVSIAVLPVAAPPPAVAWISPPAVYAVGSHRVARVTATVDPQGADARVHVEWGVTPGAFDHLTADQAVGSGSGPVSIGPELTDLPDGKIIYFRLVARNDSGGSDPGDVGRGTTRSEVGTLVVTPGRVQPSPPTLVTGAVWLDRWQWAGIALLFAAACGALRVMPPEHRGWAAGTLAAVLIWFDPTLLVNAHVWPQWDVYLMPPFLLATLLASLDWWLAAGLVVGIGCMFKGQFLIGAPVLLMWPIVSLRWGAAVRLAVGAALSAGVLMSPWLVLAERTPADNPQPLWWIAGVAAAAVAGVAFSLYRASLARFVGQWTRWGKAWIGERIALRTGRAPKELATRDAAGPAPAVSLVPAGLFAGAALAAIMTVTLLVVHRWPADARAMRLRWAGWLLLGLLLVPWVLKRRSLDVWAAVVLVVAVWGSSFVFHGDWSWETVGFEYGLHKHDHLEISHGSGSNVGTVLQRDFGWDIHDGMITFRPPDVAGLLYSGHPGPVPRWFRRWSLDGSSITFDVRQTLMITFGLLVLIAGIGAAVQDRRNDPRLLAAIVAPWMLMPSVLAQMMDRYEVWGAVFSCLLIGVSAELGLLHVLVTLAAAGMIGGQLLTSDPSRSPAVLRLVTGLGAHEAGLLLAAGLLVLVVGVVPNRRRDLAYTLSA